MPEEKSELLEKLEETIVNFMQEKANVFSNRAEAYSVYCSRKTIEARLREIDRLLETVREPENINLLTKTKKECIDSLNKTVESGKTLQEKLDLPIVMNYAADQINILLPLNSDEREKQGLWARLYKSLSIAVGSPKESLSYCGLSVIRAPKRSAKKISRKIEGLTSENDFEKAKVHFEVDEIKFLLDLSKIGSAEKRIMRGAIRPSEEEAIYGLSDLANRIGLTRRGAYNVVRRFLKDKKMEDKLPGVGYPFKFTESELIIISEYYGTRKEEVTEKMYNINDVAKKFGISQSGAAHFIKNYYKKEDLEHMLPGKGLPYRISESELNKMLEYRGSMKRGVLREPLIERKYKVKDVAQELGITPASAMGRIGRYFKRHRIEHKPRTEYKLTEKQFKEVTSKRAGICPSTYRNDVIELIKTGKNDEQIKEEIKGKYGIKSMGILQGIINLYRGKYPKGQI